MRRPLPTILIRQRDGDFLAKTEHDQNILDERCLEAKNVEDRDHLILNTTTKTQTYLQPVAFKMVLQRRGDEDYIDKYFERLGFGKPLAYDEVMAGKKSVKDTPNYSVEAIALFPSVENPNRFIDANKLGDEHRDAWVMIGDGFFQNGRDRKDGSTELYGNFSKIIDKISQGGRYDRPLLVSQLALLDKMKAATMAAISRPNFVLPPEMTQQDHNFLISRSAMGAEAIPDHLLKQIPLRLNYPIITREVSREATPSEGSDDELPYVPLSEGIETVSVNRNGVRCKRKRKDDVEPIRQTRQRPDRSRERPAAGVR